MGQGNYRCEGQRGGVKDGLGQGEVVGGMEGRGGFGKNKGEEGRRHGARTRQEGACKRKICAKRGQCGMGSVSACA